MGQLVFQATLGGQVNLVGPNTASTFNINVPAVAGNMVTTGDTGTVTNTMLAGSIANAKLTNSSVTIGSTSVALGATAATVAGLALTTPDIGTPSAGTLTNCTGLPAATGLTGLVAQANGGTGTTTGYYGFKNRIINGAMMIDQRNAGASVTLNASTSYIVDRFGGVEDTDGGMTGQQSSQAPEGFTKSIVFTTTSADASLGSTQYCIGVQRIEGNNIADLGWGTAVAKTVTMSFWVRSSLTGTFSGSLVNSAADRSYPFTYTISAANTWEQKSVTIAGDTSGTWLTDNGIGIRVQFCLGAGSSYLGTANAWASGLLFGATGTTSVIGTSGATFYITGVQLEKGSTATSFDYRPYGTELALCQRYYQRSSSYCYIAAKIGGNTGWVYSQLPVVMRATGTGSIISVASTIGANWTIDAITSSSIAFGNTSTGELRQNIDYSLSSEL